MPTIIIDGKTCEFEGKKTIVQVAHENNIPIPTYCYHEGLSIVASCRICLASVGSPNPRANNEFQWIPKLVPTCQTFAADQMQVNTKSETAIANQKAVMEYLLINHPLDCPVCDQAGECYLQDYSFQYGRGSSRFEEDKIKQPKKDVGNNVLLYADRCIMCTRCVRFTREVTGTGELCVSGRGAKEEIDVFPGKALNNELSANVIDLCPVGALLDKNFLFEQRVWFLKSTPAIDGTTAGGDNIYLEHNDGKMYRIKPRKNLEVNKWWISDEIRYSWDFIHSDLRLNEVKVKTKPGDEVNEIAKWADTYDLIRETARTRITKQGKQLALMISPMLTCEEAWMLTSLAKEADPNAIIGMGPVPIDGEDKTFPGGYTIYAEKAPNARGVKRGAEMVVGEGQVLDYAEFVTEVSGTTTKSSQQGGDGSLGMLILTGNYTSEWVTDEIMCMADGAFTVLMDTLASPLSFRSDVFLPTCTFAEKAGTFENAKHQLQSFQQALQPLEMTRSEGQIASDLLSYWRVERSSKFNAADVRDMMGEDFKSMVSHPVVDAAPESDMQYVEL